MPVHLLETDDSFHEAVKVHSIVIVDFFAVWCVPCKVLAPILEEFSNDYRYKDIFFAKINVETLPTLCDELGVEAMPTIVVFKRGTRLGGLVNPDKAKLEEMMESSLDEAST